MLGLLLLYFVWKRFADLAERFHKPRRSNGWYGILSYFGGVFVAVILFVFLDIIFEWNIDWDNDRSLNFIAIPFGLLGCYLLYAFFEKKWRSQLIKVDSIDDIGTDQED